MTGMLSRGLLIACCACACASLAQAAPKIYAGHGEYRLAPRFALVVGVPSVQPGTGFQKLTNPLRDAEAVSSALEDVGFVVFAPHRGVRSPVELTRQRIKMAIYDFAWTLKTQGGVGVFYYSGHAVERAGKSYLAPYDAFIRFGRDLEEDFIPISLLYQAFQYAGNPLNIMFLDACRDWPWSHAIGAFSGAEMQQGALTAERTDEEKNVIRSNATLSGGKALDGKNLSPYAGALVASLQRTDRSLKDLLHDDLEDFVSEQVGTRQTVINQVPSGREFFFRPTERTYQLELQVWQSAAKSGNRRQYERLATRYSGGYFARAARKILASHDFAPLPTGAIVEVTAPEVRVLQSESLSSALVETQPRGTILAVAPSALVDPKFREVALNSQSKPAYISSNALKDVPLDETSVRLHTVAVEGSVARALTPESIAALHVLRHRLRGSAITRIEVTGYVLPDTVQGAEELAILNQTAVIAEMNRAEIDVSRALVTLRRDPRKEMANVVEVTVGLPAL